MSKVKMVFNFYGYSGGGVAGSIFDTMGLSPALRSTDGGGNQPIIFVIYDKH